MSNITAGNRAQIQVKAASPGSSVLSEEDLLFCVCVVDNISSCQNVIDANIFPVLIEILQKAEFRTRKEAAWAITNATSGGTPAQIRHVQQTSTLWFSTAH